MFYIGATMMILCTLAQFLLRNNQFSKYYLKPYAGYRETIDATPVLIARRGSADLDGKNEVLLNTPSSTLAKTNSTATEQQNCNESNSLRSHKPSAFCDFLQ